LKAKLAFGILMLACTSVAGNGSCPVGPNASAVILKTISPDQRVNPLEKATDFRQKYRPGNFESCILNEKSGCNVKILTSHNLPVQGHWELMPASIANLIDLSISKSDFTGCIIIDIQKTFYLAFPHPQPERTIAAFIRNGILRF